MLLRLVPTAPLPTILFTLSFPTLPQSLPIPVSWENHLQLLVHYQLTAPPSLHALDKSVAWTALLDTVTFDLVSLTVTCIFVDGVHEEWPLTNRCVDLLDSVIRDVNRSATEAEIEHDLESRKTDAEPNLSSNTHASLSSAEQLSEQTTPVVSQKVQKPRKRRSILGSLMAALVPSSSLSALVTPYRVSTPPPPPPPPPPPLPIVIEDPEPLTTNGMPASRFLRRRARSTLVDAYRRFVVGELSARFRTGESMLHKTNGGGFETHGMDVGVPQTPQYALWVTRSTMRRVSEEMARIIEYALFANQGRECNRAAEQNSEHCTDKFKEDDRDGDDSGSASSMTDGSSVHTPLDFHDAPFPCNQLPLSPSKHQPSPSHSPTVMTPQTYHAYISFKEMHHRLHGIASQLTAETAAQAQAAAAEAGGAEVKSKRRAWSSRQYLAGSRTVSSKGESGVLGGASMALVGLAVPVRSSPLCRGWNAEELEAHELTARKSGRCVRWEKEVECGEMLRRLRSLYGEQSQRKRCYSRASGKSCEAEDVHGLGRVRPRVLDMNAEADPFGLVYSTGPRRLAIDHADIDEEEHEEDDEDEHDLKNQHDHKHEYDHGDDILYQQRSEEEFILHPSQESSTPLRPGLQSHLMTPQSTKPQDLRPGISMPISLMTPKLLPSAAVAMEEFGAEPIRLSDPDTVCVVEVSS